MKKLLTAAVCLLSFITCKAQTDAVSTFRAYDNGEFKTYSNGLIYSDTTMHQLTRIVDSLNLKFKRCDLNRKYYAISQGIGHYVTLSIRDTKKALDDIKANINYNDFIQKYKSAKADTNMLILKKRYYNDYTKRWISEFTGENMQEYNKATLAANIDSLSFNNPLQGKWVISYSGKTSYSDESLEAFYITTEFKTLELPQKYARMILYSDCVIDTTTDVFIPNASESGRFWGTNKKRNSNKLDMFMDYLTKSTAHITEKDVPGYEEYKWYAMDSMKRAWIIANLSHTEKFKRLLEDAVKEVKQKNIVTDDAFENYVANYYSKPDALQMKRNRRVIGGCSQDESPRLHAVNIATLSAETVNWEVFLRAHLNIMNDRFDRMSDGSYAWGQRKTYIKELEDLNIEVQELLFGICLRIENPVAKHYYGSIGRLGRALAETKNRAQLEEQLLAMIRDNELDTYNRMLMHYLYLNYVYYLPGKEVRISGLAKLDEADKTLPLNILSRIKINKENFTKRD